MSQAVIGTLAMGFSIAGLFFLRFWHKTHDRLFGLFALSFFLQAMSRVGFAFIDSRDTRGDYLYWLRLVAFAMILLAIIDKNLFRKSASP